MTTQTSPHGSKAGAARAKPDNVLEISGLRTHFGTIDGIVKAVDGVSFEIKRGVRLRQERDGHVGHAAHRATG